MEIHMIYMCGRQAASRESRALEEHMDGYISFMTDYKFAPPPSDSSPAVLAWQAVQTPSPKETRA